MSSSPQQAAQIICQQKLDIPFSPNINIYAKIWTILVDHLVVHRLGGHQPLLLIVGRCGDLSHLCQDRVNMPQNREKISRLRNRFEKQMQTFFSQPGARLSPQERSERIAERLQMPPVAPEPSLPSPAPEPAPPLRSILCAWAVRFPPAWVGLLFLRGDNDLGKRNAEHI